MEPENYCVIDLEMTGLSATRNQILEVGAVRVRGGTVTDCFSMLVNPKRPIPGEVQELTGITDAMVEKALSSDEVVPLMLEFIGDDIVVGHNVSFDYRFLKQWAVNHKISLNMKFLDTLKIARAILPGEQSKKLGALCQFFAVSREHAHRAVDDALATAAVLEKLKPMAREKKRDDLLRPGEIQIRVKKQTPATEHQIQRLKQYMELHHIGDDIPWETLTRSEASRIADRYRAKYGK